MAAAVRVEISLDELAEILGGCLPYAVEVLHATVVYKTWRRPTLEVVVTGEHLPAVFQVQDGARLLYADLVINRTYGTAQLVPLEDGR